MSKIKYIPPVYNAELISKAFYDNYNELFENYNITTDGNYESPFDKYYLILDNFDLENQVRFSPGDIYFRYNKYSCDIKVTHTNIILMMKYCLDRKPRIDGNPPSGKIFLHLTRKWVNVSKEKSLA
jgi:hypothetical protein